MPFYRSIQDSADVQSGFTIDDTYATADMGKRKRKSGAGRTQLPSVISELTDFVMAIIDADSLDSLRWKGQLVAL